MTSEAQIIANHRYAQLFACLNTSFNHFSLIMQNKPNLLDSQMNVISFTTRGYENKFNWTLGENKPNSNPIQTQSKPISKQNKPNQTQPVVSLSNLFQSQSNPKEQPKNPELPLISLNFKLLNKINSQPILTAKTGFITNTTLFALDKWEHLNAL